MGTSCPTSPLCHSSLRQIWPRKQVSLPQISQNQNNSDLQSCMCFYDRVFRPHCATGYLELSDAVADANHLRRWTLFTKHYFTLFFFLLRALPCWSISQVLQAATKPQVDFYFKQGRIWLHWITARKLVQLSSSIYNCICLVTSFPDRRCSSNISLTLKTDAQPSRSVFRRQEAACFQVFFASNYLKSKQRFC